MLSHICSQGLIDKLCLPVVPVSCFQRDASRAYAAALPLQEGSEESAPSWGKMSSIPISGFFPIENINFL